MSTTPFTEYSGASQAGFDIPVDLHILDGESEIVPARIRRVDHSVFELSCSEMLKAGQRLALSHAGHRIQVEVSSSTSLQPDGYLLIVRIQSNQPGAVRSELRLPIDLPATLQVSGRPEEIVARIVDMSPSGMGIELEKALPEGAKVCVTLEQGLAFGQIRFCRPSAGKHFAGFMLEEYICQ